MQWVALASCSLKGLRAGGSITGVCCHPSCMRHPASGTLQKQVYPAPSTTISCQLQSMKHFRKSSKPAYRESHVDFIFYFMTQHCLGYNISCKGLEILGTARKSLLLSGGLVKHLTFSSSEKANKCCQKITYALLVYRTCGT